MKAKSKLKVIKSCRKRSCGSASESWETMVKQVNVRMKKAA